MKSKTLIAVAIGALFSAAPVLADKATFYSEASEENPIRDTADMITGGYRGWGPMHNPVSAAADIEATVQRHDEMVKDRKQHFAEVHQARERVWVANAPLREPYESRQAFAAYMDQAIGATAVGGTSGSGGGYVHYRSDVYHPNR